MVVLDVTRMEGDRVCVGGYLEDGTAMWPVAGRAGPNQQWLAPTRDGRVAPFAVLELKVDRAPHGLRAPHTEDRTVPMHGHRVLGMLPAAERIAWLEATASPAVRAIFGADVHADEERPWGRYVHAGDGARSLGTIRAREILAVQYQFYPERGRWDYRLRFRDAKQEEFQLAVVDLAFRGRLDELTAAGLSAREAAARTLAALRRQKVYLRIGLARGWERHPDRCYLQITGVYGFEP
jgi:hypothetical protein